MLTLTSAGRTTRVITLASSAPAPERNAARELAAHLRSISGARFPIVTPERAGPRPVIAVGPRAACAAGLPSTALRGLGDEGLLIRTCGDNLILTGGIAAPRGTLYAVYEFLEETLGCRWWTAQSSFTPGQTTMQIPALNRRHIPEFEYREIMYRENWDTGWSVRNRTNGRWEKKPFGIPSRWGGHVKFALWVHTMIGSLVPADKFKDAPDWFAEVDGKRTPEQLCLANQEVLDHVIRRVRGYLRADPSARVVSISQNDNHVYCKCARCTRLDRREGSPAGSVLRFVNAVADILKKEFPKVAVETLAYLYSRKPPRHIRPRPNVIVRLCSFECDFLHPLNHANNRSFMSDLRGWGRICKRVYIWDYVTNYAHFVLPNPNWFVLDANIRIFRDNNVRGVFEQADNSSLGGEFAHMRSWVLAKLLWNPALNGQKLIREFLDGYYGAAGDLIARYLELVHTRASRIKYYQGSDNIQKCLKQRGYPPARSGCYLDINAQPDAPFLTPAVVLNALELFQKAEKAVSVDQELVDRVRRAAMGPMYVALLRWDELKAYARDRQRTWPLARKRIQTFKIFSELSRAIGITHLGEGWSHRDLPWLKQVCCDNAKPW